MIKHFYRCDPLPFALLSLVLLLGLPIGASFSSSLGDCTALSQLLPFISSVTFAFIFLLSIQLTLPLLFKASITRSGILDFNERVSLYPVGLLVATALPSDNNLLFFIASGLILWLFSRLISIKEGEAISSTAFFGGFVISLMTLISPFFIVMILFLWAALSSMSSLNWRAILWSIFGLGLTAYLHYTLSYITTGEWPSGLYDGALIADTARLNGATGIWWLFYLPVFLGLAILMGVKSIQSARRGVVARRRVIRVGILLFITTSLISGLIFQFEGASSYLSLMAVPLGVFFLEFVRERSSMLSSVLFILWLILSAGISWT